MLANEVEEYCTYYIISEKNTPGTLITHLLLTEFEVCTVSYGPSFFLSIYGPSVKRAGHKSTGKNEDL